MLSCTGPLVLPDYRIFAHALAIQVPCTVLLHVVGVFIYLVRRQRRLSFLLWPSAAALAALPFWLLPFAEARLGPDAQFGVFVGATAFSFAAFRTAEAALGTTPPAATVSLAAWLLYFTSSLDPVYADGLKPVAAPANALRNRLARLPVRMLALGALCSLLLPHGARSPLGSELARLGASPLVCLWVSNVVYSVALWLFLALCFDIGAAPLLAQGVAAGEAFLNPVFASHSPKEFWGKRWNLQVACPPPPRPLPWLVRVPASQRASASRAGSAIQSRALRCARPHVAPLCGRRAPRECPLHPPPRPVPALCISLSSCALARR